MSIINLTTVMRNGWTMEMHGCGEDMNTGEPCNPYFTCTFYSPSCANQHVFERWDCCYYLSTELLQSRVPHLLPVNSSTKVKWKAFYSLARSVFRSLASGKNVVFTNPATGQRVWSAAAH